MPDNKSRRGPEDGWYVSVNQRHEVRYWTGKWKCSEQELRDAVARVGPRVKNVAQALGVDTSKPDVLVPPEPGVDIPVAPTENPREPTPTQDEADRIKHRITGRDENDGNP